MNEEALPQRDARQGPQRRHAFPLSHRCFETDDLQADILGDGARYGAYLAGLSSWSSVVFVANHHHQAKVRKGLASLGSKHGLEASRGVDDDADDGPVLEDMVQFALLPPWVEGEHLKGGVKEGQSSHIFE